MSVVIFTLNSIHTYHYCRDLWASTFRREICPLTVDLQAAAEVNRF